MPFLLGLIFLSATSIVAAVPLNDGSCRMLFLGPGIGYVLITAGLLSRIIQHTMRAHIVLHWLLIFFVVLNQMVISVAYLLRTTRRSCQLTVHDQLLMMLYPALLIGVVLLLVYRTARRTRSQWKSREAIHVGLATTFSGAFAGCWLGAACVLGDALLSSCLGFGCLASAVIVSLISLIPRQERMEPNDESIFSDKEEIYNDGDPHQGMRKFGDYFESRGPEKPIIEPGAALLISLHLNLFITTEVFVIIEIIIVPITPDGQALPDIALQAIKARNQQCHHHLQQGGRRSHDGGGRHHHHHHHHQQRPHRWHNKLRTSDMTVGRRIKTLRSRKETTSRGLARNASEKVHRTPYNHRGWLY